MINTYNIGDKVVISAAYTADGAAFDPTGSVTFGIRFPDNSESFYVYDTDAEVVKDSVGNYHMHVYPVVAGRYHYRTIGVGTTGDNTERLAAAEKSFSVRPSAFTDPLNLA